MITLKRNQLLDKLKNNSFKFAWINTYSNLLLTQIKELNKETINNYLDDLIEAKLFNEKEEISIVKDEKGNYSVIKFVANNNDDYIEESQILQKHKTPLKEEYQSKDNNFTDKLVIRHYLDYDDDGQAYVKYTKLCDVKREVNSNVK